MARFSYVAQDRANQVTQGALDAPDRIAALQRLTDQGLTPIKIQEERVVQRPAKERSRFSFGSIFKSNLSTFDQIIIVRHLGIILNTGTDILTALDIIARDAIKPLVKQILYDIKARVTNGERLSVALQAWKDQFNPILISLVKSGEDSGDLPGTLISYAQELKNENAFVRRVRGASFYPAILLTALGGMLIIILTFVAPRLKDLFSDLRARPPIQMRIFFAASDFLLHYTIPIAIVLGIMVLVIIVALRNRNVRLRVTTALRFLPVISRIQMNLTLMRFTKTVANLIDAGFGLKAALITTSEVVDIRYRRTILEINEKSLEHGISLSDSIRKYPKLFPDILVSAVATGEKSGKLSTVLRQMGEFYEENVLYGLETFLTLIEPILLVIVGVIVGLMAASIISPIYQLIGKIR